MLNFLTSTSTNKYSNTLSHFKKNRVHLKKVIHKHDPCHKLPRDREL